MTVTSEVKKLINYRKKNYAFWRHPQYKKWTDQYVTNRRFPSCFEPHYESEAKCKVFIHKIIFHSYANKTNFHMKSFALSLAFIMRLTATRKWPIIVDGITIMLVIMQQK